MTQVLKALKKTIFRKNSQNIWRVKKKAVPLHRFLGDSLAQQVEHIPFKDGVVGSSPTRITQWDAVTSWLRF